MGDEGGLLGLVGSWSWAEVGGWLSGVSGGGSSAGAAAAGGGLSGRELLLLTHGDLVALGEPHLGTRQAILSALRLLNAACYDVERENAATIALDVVLAARELAARLETAAEVARVLAAISSAVDAALRLISWLDRRPFADNNHYIRLRNAVMSIGRGLSNETKRTTGLLDSRKLHNFAIRLAKEAGSLVSGSKDPLLQMTASVETLVIRKPKEGADVGLGLADSYRGEHVITELRSGSLAELCGRLAPGDELLAVNRMAVLGWPSAAVAAALTAPAELKLIVKKRPLHTSSSKPSTPHLLRPVHLRPSILISSTPSHLARQPSSKSKRVSCCCVVLSLTVLWT